MKSALAASVALLATLATLASAQQSAYGQCGGNGWTGATACASGYHCSFQNPYYSQCLPGAASTVNPPTTTARTTLATVTTKPAPTSAPVSGAVKYAGVNIAGFDFGCGTDGTCVPANAYPPLSPNGPDGAGQMSHLVKDDHLNMFRLPVGWQYLTNNVLEGTLNAANLANYDQLVQACLATGATCIIDIHNYARWNGGIIGQGGPTNAQFASLWSQIASKYANTAKVAFGIMNEPHDIPNIITWAATVQAAVTAIRTAGAKSQLILLPGNDYTSASGFISNGSGDALTAVTNLDGSTANLIFDVHKYLDSDSSGTHAECVTNNIDSAFAPLATWLRSHGRQAMLTETGGGNVASCVTSLCQQIAYLNANSDVYLGYTSWAAGSFDSSYVLTETPTNSNGAWTDTLLLKSCIRR